MKRVHVMVRGEVQGVGYRYTAHLAAREIGVAGWVQNRSDGSVEAEVEGTEDQVERMLVWLAGGPRSARVSSLTTTEVPLQAAAGFEILPTA